MPRRPGLGRILLAGIAALAVSAMTLPANAGVAFEAGAVKRYVVVFEATQRADGTYDMAADRSTALSAIAAAGGNVTLDLSGQIGVMVVESSNALLADTLRSTGLVAEVAEDFKWKAFPSYGEAVETGALVPLSHPGTGHGGPEETEDPLEPLQWSMRQIRAPEAHAIQAGWDLVEVGILDTGIDGLHQDFVVDTGGTNVDCVKGRDFIPLGPGVGNPAPCVDNNFHGTHVAGIVAAQANELGVVGVAPNVTLIPVKVCDALGFCYSSSTAAGITYAGDAKFEVINMSFFVDDDVFLQSTEFKCMSDPVQRAFRLANERAIQYARSQGVAPVAALGNSDNDLAHPPEPYENECEVVPAETQGVVGTMALGPGSEKAFYSNYGVGATDVAAPGGNSRSEHGEFPGPCGVQVLSTIPGNNWGCFQGTSMASPHAAGVAALIVSEFGRIGNDAGETDVVLRPQTVESYLESTTIDIGLAGYDECFGNGRVDALRAVQHDTSRLFQTTPPCPEYEE
jgi:subtilisin family serine protease